MLAYRFSAAAFIIGMILVSVPATAQFPSDDPEPSGKGKKSATAAGPNITGNWAGQLTQVGSESPYKFEISIDASGAETKYPDLNCLGRLTRVGSSKSYAFFVEAIIKGQVSKGGRCPDGTVTVARQGDDLAVGWFGSVKGSTIVAYGNLKKK